MPEPMMSHGHVQADGDPRSLDASDPPACPFCDNSIPAEPVGAGRFWCGCCARLFHVSDPGAPR